MGGLCGRLNGFDQRYLLKTRGKKHLDAEVGGHEVGGVRGDDALAGPGAAPHEGGEGRSACPASQTPTYHGTQKKVGVGVGVISGEAAACISPASIASPH